MTKFVYSWYNKKGQFYNAPFTDDHNPKDKVEELKQGLLYAKMEDCIQLLDCDFYLIGEFDTLTGAFEFKNEFLAPIGDQLAIQFKGGEDHGTN